MSLIELQAWLPSSDLSGAPDHTFSTDDQLVDAGFNPVLWGEGDGFLEIHADDSDAQYLQRRGFIRAVRTDTNEGLFWWILEEGSVKLLSMKRKVEKVIRWDGRGMLYYLDRYRLGQAVWAPGQPNRGSVSVIDYWTWIDQPMIAILTRFMEEGQYDTRADFLDKLEYDFSRTQDSNGNSLTAVDQYQVRIGTGGLTVAADAMRQGNLLQVLPDTPPTLQAFRALSEYRTDRSSGTFASGKVRFAAGVNIGTELPHKIVALRERTHTLTRRQDGQYATEALNGTGEPYMDFLEVPSTSDPDAVEAIVGQSHLNREKQSTVAVIRHIIGPGGASGADGYFPSPAGDYWLGDLVTVHVGSDEYDLNEQALEVAGIRYFLRGADWMVEAQLGAQVINSAGAPINVPTAGPTIPRGPQLELCQPSAASGATFGPVGLIDSVATASGDDTTSDYWTGYWEERLQIVTDHDIPVGSTLIATVAWNRDPGNETRPSQVYDAQGNTWVKDAESDEVGASHYITQIWRTTLGTALANGDYIRWAAKMDTVEDDPNADAFGRAFGVFEFAGVLTDPNVGASAESFGSTHTVPAPAGDIVIGSLARHEGAVTGDGDWTALVPWTAQVLGAGHDQVGVFGQYKLAVTSENWVTTGSGSKDWTGIAVGYTAEDPLTYEGDGPLVGTAPRAARCDHNHYLEDLATLETDTSLVPHPDGAGGVEWGADATGGGGGGSPIYDIERYTAGDISLGSGTSPVAVSGPGDLVVSAAAGDLLMLGLSCRNTDTDADSLSFDFATIVSAAAVNFVSSLTGTPVTTGVAGWYLGVSRVVAAHGEQPYVVQGGDISGGNVTLRLYYRVSGAGKVLGASAGTPLVFWVRNLGQ